MTICNKTALCPRGGVDMARKDLNEEFQFHRHIFLISLINMMDGFHLSSTRPDKERERIDSQQKSVEIFFFLLGRFFLI
jgi:hypothetical protein